MCYIWLVLNVEGRNIIKTQRGKIFFVFIIRNLKMRQLSCSRRLVREV